MLDTYDIIQVLRLTQARHIDAARDLLYHNSARFVGLCESKQPHSATKRAFCVSKEAEMMKQCPVCRKEFRVKLSAAARRVCCSKACYAQYLKTAMLGSANPNYRDGREGICTVCHKPFPNYSARRRTCSRECSSKNRTKIRIPQQTNFLDQCGFRWCKCIKCSKEFQFRHSAKRYCPKCKPEGIYYKRCPTCKAEFSTHYHNRKHCSRECYNVAIAERQKGEKSHRWKGGLTSPDKLLRNSKEYIDWRKAVFARDDYTCQLCFERGGKLAAHHIREYAKHPDLRLLAGNGITLCWPCHRSIKDKERLYETTFYDITGGIK